MERNEMENLEKFKKLTARYFHTLKPGEDQTQSNTAQLKFVNYYELGCVITNMLRLCIVALDEHAPKFQETEKNETINVGLILETVLQLFPMDELEFLSELSQLLATES
ncbi:hypothetical protein [Flavobacterium sp. WG21]|uniref:hypothetical protein n=1 Tax=Flavobacterium sp. WG21 TaxID=1229487 RepID=UPI00034BE5BC|nr:hypothetical protein [Flavobacterium sp. WG21]